MFMVVLKPVSTLLVGVYTVNVTTIVDNNRSAAVDSSKLIVNRIPSTVIPVAEDIHVGEVSEITVVVGFEDATGTVNITVDNKIYTNVSVINGKATIDVSNLRLGVYDVDDIVQVSKDSTKDISKENTQSKQIKNSKSGLSLHEIANPILGLFMVLIALGLGQSTRFKK